MRKCLLVAVAIALAAWNAPLSGQATQSWAPFFGVSGLVGQVPQPFAVGCPLIAGEKMGGGVGAQLFLGARMSEAFDIQTRYTVSKNSNGGGCAFADVPGTWSARVRTYDEDSEGEGLNAVDLQAGFSPAQLRLLRISAGFGLELQSTTPFLVGGVGVRLGNNTKFVSGLDVMAFRTRYIIADDYYEGYYRVNRNVISEGYEHTVSWMLRVGAEIPFTRKSR